MSEPLELAEAVVKTLQGLKYNDTDINFFFGNVKSVEYPLIDVYFSRFTTSTANANLYADINAGVVVEFAYAKETDDTELYSFSNNIIDKLKQGLQFIHRGKNFIITPEDDFEVRIVDGYLQITFGVKYQVDTEAKVKYDNLEKMEQLDIDIGVK